MDAVLAAIIVHRPLRSRRRERKENSFVFHEVVE